MVKVENVSGEWWKILDWKIGLDLEGFYKLS